MEEGGQKKLSVHLVTWNGAKYIPLLFQSLRAQTYRDWKLYIWDNASADSTVRAIEAELPGFPAPYELRAHGTNLGFAGGHNAVYAATREEYFLLLNQDMFLAPECLGRMAAFLDAHPEAAAVTPRLMKWDFAGGHFTDRIDSLGLKVFRNRRVVEWLAGEEWRGDNIRVKNLFTENSRPVFGVSGALPMYRRAAVEKVAFAAEEFLDAGYHSYKEDVDLAFRLRAAGFSAFVLLNTPAYHDRSAAGAREYTDRAAAQNKGAQSPWVRHHSYKNHLMTLYKNEYWQNLGLDFPWILWYELKKFAWFLLFDRPVLSGLREIWRGRKKLAVRRKFIRDRRVCSWKELRIWWTN